MRAATMLLVTLLAGYFMQAQASLASSNSACLTATHDCTEWVALDGGPARSLIYRSYSLDKRNDAIHQALVIIHGARRNADHYFNTAIASAFLAGTTEDTVVISPRIASSNPEDSDCSDKLDSNEVNWSCEGDSWRSGGSSTSHPHLTSFDLIDQILRKLANKAVFPNLTKIVIAGHSAGGQFVMRYQMANRVHDLLGVPITYIVSNPSSYAWPVSARPMPYDDAAPDNAKEAWNSEEVHTQFSYNIFDATSCADYDEWPYGLKNRIGGYTAKTSNDQLKKQLVSRPMIYLLSQVDVLPLGGFDSSCAAMAQGPTRRSRGEAYVKYMNERLGAKHGVQIISECGHNDRCVFTSDEVLPVIFPKVVV